MEMSQNNLPGMVLFYTGDYKKKRQILQLCRQLGIRTKELKVSDSNLSLSLLAAPGKKPAAYFTQNGPDKGKKAPADYQLPEIMVFSGFSGDYLDQFLSAYKQAGIEKISLKAILTPYNFGWSLYELIKELEKEHMEILLRSRQ